MKNNLTEFITVNSAVIKNVWYSHSDNSLVLDFKSGASYLYRDVPLFLFEGLRSSESKGSFINRYVIAKFSFKKL
jgi:hypothetical protein